MIVSTSDAVVEASELRRNGRRVKAEYASPLTQFAETFDGEEIPISWAVNPNVANLEENQARAGVLNLLRPMVGGLPDNVVWRRARAPRTELEEFLYMLGHDWADLSGGTRRIGDGARLFTAKCHDPTLRSAVLSISRVLASIEGHKRATAYVFGRKAAVTVVDLIIGMSADMSQFEFL
jgi:hypothetical protein